MSLRLTERLVLASHNKGKLREIEALIAPLGWSLVSAAALGLPEPEETGSSFEENAALKARAAALSSGLTALADDSGLCVPSLDGAPGIYSARWAGEKKDFTLAMQRIADELKQRGLEPQGAAAYFVCVLALADTQGEIQTLRGEVHGQLTFPPRGDDGFGYDPIFVPQGYSQTFGEMQPEAKHRISHRAKAFEQLSALLRKERAA